VKDPSPDFATAIRVLIAAGFILAAILCCE